METVRTEALTSPELLSNEEIADLLPILDDVIGWAKQVQEYALTQALNGEKYPGFKVVEGRSLRKFENEDKVSDLLIGEGYDEAMIYERKLLSLSKLETLLGKKRFNSLLGDEVFKPKGKPALVDETDPRPEYIDENSAIDDFKDE